MRISRKELQQIIKEELEAVLDEAEICKAGKDWVDGKTIGGQLVKRGEDGKFNNWSARAAQIASKYCKDPNYGRGKSKKDESIEEGSLGDWEKENWTHSDGTPCGAGEKDGSQSRCKPAAKWKTMSKSEKAADDAKKKAGTKAGKQYVSATKKGKVTKSYTKQESLNRIIDEIIEEELEAVLNERCQKGYKTHPTQKTKEMFGKTYRNCVKAEEGLELEEEKDFPEKVHKKARYIQDKEGKDRDQAYAIAISMYEDGDLDEAKAYHWDEPDWEYGGGYGSGRLEEEKRK